MDKSDCLGVETVEAWREAFGRILTLLPRSKKMVAFDDAEFVEMTAMRWLKLAREKSPDDMSK